MPKAPLTSFARPGTGTAPKAPLPPPRPGAKPNATTATTAAPKPPAPPKPKVAAPPEPVAVATEVETEVVPPAPAVPSKRGRPPGAPNKAKMPEPSTALALQEAEDTGRVVVFTGQAGRIEGDIDTSDITLPQFKVASGFGPLKLLEDPIVDGALVIGAVDQWMYLFNGEGWEPVGLTVIRARKSLAQIKNDAGEVLYDIDEQGLIVDTKEEMKAAGGSLQDVLGVKVFEPVLMVHALIRLPEGAEDPMALFDIEIEGVMYAQAMWKIRGSSYRDCAKKIYDESKEGRFLGQVSYSGEFLTDSKYIKGDKNAWYIPHLENGEKHTEAFMEVAATL